MKKTKDHIIIDISRYPHEIVCKNCGEIMKFHLPMAVDVFLAMSKAFVKIHKACLNKSEVLKND